MSKLRNTLACAITTILIAAALPVSAPVYSDDWGAFIGGVAAARIGANMRRRTAAQEEMAYNSSRAAQAAQPVQQVAPAPATQTQTQTQTQTTEQKLNELDKLAAGGYITPAEYKARRKAILDSL
jgi:hypothetical protein